MSHFPSPESTWWWHPKDKPQDPKKDKKEKDKDQKKGQKPKFI